MPSGSKPGERRGGRGPGVPNKTSKAKSIAIAAQRQKAGRKLAVDVMSELMNHFVGMAAKYQPLGATPDEKKFTLYAKQAASIASDLAAYETPKLASTTLRGDEDSPIKAEIEFVIVGKDGKRASIQ